MTNPEFQTVPAWFMTEIASGLQALYALSLEGNPGADVLQATVGVWARDLWNSRKRSWHQQADTGCIRTAFALLRQTSERWPTPSKFWTVLPDRAPPPTNALIDEQWGRERQADALACMRRQFAQLGRNQWGEEIEP